MTHRHRARNPTGRGTMGQTMTTTTNPKRIQTMATTTPGTRAPDHRERPTHPSPAPIPYHRARAIIAAAVDLQRAASADAMGRTPQTCAALMEAAKRAALAQMDHDAAGYHLIAHPDHLTHLARTCAAWLEGWSQRPEEIARRAQIAEHMRQIFGEEPEA